MLMLVMSHTVSTIAGILVNQTSLIGSEWSDVLRFSPGVPLSGGRLQGVAAFLWARGQQAGLRCGQLKMDEEL